MEVRLNGDGTATVTGLEQGEGLFALRQRDALAYPTINFYRMIADGLFDADRERGLTVVLAEFAAYAHRRQATEAAQLRFPD